MTTTFSPDKAPTTKHTPSRRAINLLRQAFHMGSGVETSEGTIALWTELEKAGLVQRIYKTMHGILGHPFAFRITDDGKAAIRRATGEE